MSNHYAWCIVVLITLLAMIPDSSSSSGSFSSLNAPYWYTQSATIDMPQHGPAFYSQIAASKDPSQPDRMFAIEAPSTVWYSFDLTTGQMSSWNASDACGYNTTANFYIVALSNSIMLYSRIGWNSNLIVILQLNHTSGECMQAWPITVTDSSLWEKGFAVDEANQQFALFTATSDGATGTLSMISMDTGAVLAINSNYYTDFLSFVPYSGNYLSGPNLRKGWYNQISRYDLSLVHTFQPWSNARFRTIFFDQAGSLIGVGDYFAYVTVNGVLTQFTSNVRGYPRQITSALNNDVICLYQKLGNIGFTTVRFKQYRPSSSSSAPFIRSSSSSAAVLSSGESSTAVLSSGESSTAVVSSAESSTAVLSSAESSTAVLSSGESLTASGNSSSAGESNRLGEAVTSSALSTRTIAAFVVVPLCFVGLAVLIGLSISYYKRRSAGSKTVLLPSGLPI